MRENCLKSQRREEYVGYEMYYDFQSPVSKMAGYRVLAINRGENEKILTVHVEAPEEKILQWLCRQVVKKDNPNTTPFL